MWNDDHATRECEKLSFQKIVFTGGSYAGKTTLISELQCLGYRVVPEAGLLIISQLNDELGIEEQRRWRAANPLAFYELIINKQQELERENSLSGEKAVFHDRGIPDYLAMLRLTGTEIPKRLYDVARLIPYHCAFVCETLSSFDDRAVTGRSLDRTASLKLQSLSLEIYNELSCPTIMLKESSVKDRMQLIQLSLQAS
jgi:predicted ATPase